ncbi:MAG: DUF971 domain-containing protein [Bacteroidota bacterium]|nr:DUF971 domain-containing protein [Bacteroidota bacterium]
MERDTRHPQPVPVGMLQEDDGTIRITWDDGAVLRYTPWRLRRACPCAECRILAERHGGTHIPLHTSDAFKLVSITPVGRYALNLRWKDGHAAGIYPFAHLRCLEPEDDDGGERTR